MPSNLSEFSFTSTPVSSPSASENSYFENTNPEDLLKNPQFLFDVRRYAKAAHGKDLYSDEDTIRWWYDNRTMRNLNTAFIAGDAIAANAEGDDIAQLHARIQRSYDASPMMWEEGGAFDQIGVGATLGSIGKALITDPLNLIGVGVAKNVGQAAFQAARAGKSVVAAGAKAGAKKAALAEGVIGAGVNALADSGMQYRDMQLGLQEEFSGERLGISAGAGGLLGAGIGGVVGAGTGAVTARSAGTKTSKQYLDKLNEILQKESAATGFAPAPQLRVTDDLQTNATTANVADDMNYVENVSERMRAEQSARARENETPDPNTEVDPELDPRYGLDRVEQERADQLAAEANLRYQEAQRRNDPQEILDELKLEANWANQITQIKKAIVETQAKMVPRMGSEDPKVRARATEVVTDLNRYIALYRALINGDEVPASFRPVDGDPDAMPDLAKAIDEVEELGRREIDVPTEEAAAPTTPAGEEAPPTNGSRPEERASPKAPEGEEGEAAPPNQPNAKPLEAIKYKSKVETDDGIKDVEVNAREYYDDIAGRMQRWYDLKDCMGG